MRNADDQTRKSKMNMTPTEALKMLQSRKPAPTIAKGARMVTFHALRVAGNGMLEERKVTRPVKVDGGSYRSETCQHIAFYPNTDAGMLDASASMRTANAATPESA